MIHSPSGWYLSIHKGPKSGSSHPLPASGSITIGRHQDNQIVISHPRVSRNHARLTIQGSTFVLEDLGSSNGTLVNGVRISGPVTLQAGDVIGLSDDVILVFDQQPYNDKTIMPSQAKPVPYAAPSPKPVVVSPAPVAPRPQPTGQGWLTFGIWGILGAIALVSVVVIAVVLYVFLSRPASPQDLATSVTEMMPTPTEAPTYTPYPTYTTAPTEPPTYTPYPTYTPNPTEPSTPTPYPTYTPAPTEPPTPTPYPTYTPYPTQPPTYTPYPTYTPARPVVMQSPQPTSTPVSPPTATPVPPYTIILGGNVHYEPWGSPGNPNGCGGPYDDERPVRRFYLQVLLTNNSRRYISEGWGPTFISASGASLPTCVFYYENLVVDPGETIDVTYGTHLPTGDYVKALVFDILNHTEVICLSPGGTKISCP